MAPVPQNITWPRGSLDFSRGALVMGILNVTLDSFSDGGLYFDPQKAIDHGLEMAAQGAAIIDIGPESTRPGSEPVDTKTQLARALPVIKALASQIKIPLSIDTADPAVAAAALDTGASIINDITALANDEMAKLAAAAQVPVIIMHMQGTPRTMQAAPTYKDVVQEVLAFLVGRAEKAKSFSIPAQRIIIDPGIGFGKTVEHNLALLAATDKFAATGYHILVGPSRKRFLAAITGKDNPADRLFATAAACAIAIEKGASIIRVHDVAPMLDIAKTASAIRAASAL